ncbi:hypothetical protein D6774_02610 [Candidatus Woesearchaeota archaeon]|nr:MAG: hypothetical protein D6774_02610 [Candidatus Woesearchaeota archaeon]
MSQDPLEKILAQFQHDPRVQAFFKSLRQTVVKNPHDAQKILDHISETDRRVIEELQQAVKDVSLTSDTYLSKITESLFRGINKGASRRNYIVQYCTTHDITEDQRLFEQVIPTDEYILEHEFIEGDALAEEVASFEHTLRRTYPFSFLYSSANEIRSLDKGHFLHGVRSRVKSRHRRTTKLTEVVCQGVVQESKPRNISDSYALAIILNDWDDLSREMKQEAKKFVKEYFDQSTLEYFGFSPKPAGEREWEDALHYAVFCFINSKTTDIDRTTVDDCIAKPMRKGNQREIDTWKGLRASVKIGTIPLEVQVKTKRMLEREYDSDSALFHPRYALGKQRELQESQCWTPVHDAIYDILDSVLHGGKDHA